MDRRNFLKILGVTSSTAVVTSCGVDKAHEKIIPHIIPPDEEVYSGKPLFFNTTCTECPANCGLTVKVHEKVYDGNRGLFPTKLDGVADHPVNDGALCMRGQAGLFRLYHPDRVKRPMMRDDAGKLRVATWQEVMDKIQTQLTASKAAAKKDVYFAGIRNGAVSEKIDDFCKKSGVERLPAFEMLAHTNLRKSNEAVFGVADIPFYNIAKADYLLTIGADILQTFVSPVSFTAQLEKAKQNNHLNWDHVESAATLTGIQANHRISAKPGSEATIIAFILQALHKTNMLKRSLPSDVLNKIPDESISDVAQQSGVAQKYLKEMVKHFSEAKHPLVIAGGVSTTTGNGAQLTTLSALLQYAMKMDGQTLDFNQTEGFGKVGDLSDVQRLIAALKGDQIGVVFLSDVDPQKALPEKLGFTKGLEKAALSVGMADVMNETLSACDIILPLSHSLESWGEAEPRAGLLSVIQPAIEPQYDSLAEGDILLKLSGNASSYKAYLFERWNHKFGETETSEMLQKGFKLAGTKNIKTKFNKTDVLAALAPLGKIASGKTLFFTPSIRTYDGRSNVLPLMQEVPDPISTVTYGEWVSVSPEDAENMEIKDGAELKIKSGDFETQLPARIQVGQPKNVYSVYMDQVENLPITKDAGEFLTPLENISVEKTGKTIPIPILSGSYEEEGRGMLPAHEDAHGHHGHDGGSLYPDHDHDTYRWGMAIDLNSCIGCNACAAACYVENNVPIVGKEEHLLGREMSWMRIQPYIDPDNIVEFVPVLCQHCDSAPCETVCPVYAAYHNEEGLNVQVYNRCVGTRYCANNCPYKVRRFNWFDHRLVEPWDKMYNPEVSVRDRGIMEKCSFCIHKIRIAKDTAKDEDRIVKDGEVVPACAQTCPTNAISFGNLMDKKSAVYQKAHSDDAYRALEELGTEPAVHYIKKSGHHQKAMSDDHA